MEIVAAVFADFVETFLGGPSQLLTRLGSRSILGHTLTRLACVGGLSRRCLLVRPRDQGVAHDALRALSLDKVFEVLPLDDGQRPRRSLIRSARKWGLESWRGSPLGTTWFDEYLEPLPAGRVLDHYRAEAVLCLDGHQPALDSAIAEQMLTHLHENADEARLVFTQAPPGVAGLILRRLVVRELLERQHSFGLSLAYRPETPGLDPITSPNCCRVAALVAQTAARLTGDTRRSRELLAAAFAELGEDCDAVTLCDWLRRPGHDRAGPLPVEIELELTTDDPLPETMLRPRGSRIPRRRLPDLDAVGRLAAELATYDDRLVVLAGHGDPLLHPGFTDVCRRVRDAGVCGLAVRTPLVELPEAAVEAMLETRVDLVEVLLDASCRDTYRTVNRLDAYDRVLANVERIQQARRTRLCPQPIVVCSLTRCSATLSDTEPFYDHWVRQGGWAVIHGYNDFAGILPPDTTLCLTPPVREPCRRLARSLSLLADGRVAQCGQDAVGGTEVARWTEQPLEAIWRGSPLTRLRQAHAELDLRAYPMCRRCGEWFRP